MTGKPDRCQRLNAQRRPRQQPALAHFIPYRRGQQLLLFPSADLQPRVVALRHAVQTGDGNRPVAGVFIPLRDNLYGRAGVVIKPVAGHTRGFQHAGTMTGAFSRPAVHENHLRPGRVCLLRQEQRVLHSERFRLRHNHRGVRRQRHVLTQRVSSGDRHRQPGIVLQVLAKSRRGRDHHCCPALLLTERGKP